MLNGAEASFSQSFYVDGTNGNDANSGTSLGQAWQTIQNAFDNATPGSTVYIRGGTYNENVYANVSGTAGNPITFRNYQSEVVILDGTGTTQNDMLYIEDQSHLIIKNITVQNKTVNYAVGIAISATASGGVDDITIKNVKITGINWTSNPNAVPGNNNNSNPLAVYGSGTSQANAITNILIDSCEIYNNITGFSEALAFDGNIDGFTVSNNRVYDNKNIGIDFAGNYAVSSNAALDQTRNGNCFRNICYNNVSNYATSAGIYVDGGKDIVIERNTCHGNGWGIEMGCEENGSTLNITVRDNIIYNNKEAGLAIGGYTASTTGQVLNCHILNNTFLKNDYSNSGSGEIYMTKMSNCEIQNNIFYTNAQNILISRDNIYPFANNNINHNCWYTPNNNSNSISVNWGASSYSSFANYQTQTGMDANSIYADPNLMNSNISNPDFHLNILINPCMNWGDPAFIPGNNETDFWGEARIECGAVDIGADEVVCPVNANEYESDFEITISPNPSLGGFSVNGLNSACLIQIYNYLGEMIYESLVVNQQKIILNASKGIYFWKISSEGKTTSGKLVIEP